MVRCLALRQIQPARRTKRISQMELAFERGVSQAFVSILEKGYLPNRPHIRTIAEIVLRVGADLPSILSAVADALGRPYADVCAELPPAIAAELRDVDHDGPHRKTPVEVTA